MKGGEGTATASGSLDASVPPIWPIIPEPRTLFRLAHHPGKHARFSQWRIVTRVWGCDDDNNAKQTPR
jgi:hypothetical protein